MKTINLKEEGFIALLKIDLKESCNGRIEYKKEKFLLPINNCLLISEGDLIELTLNEITNRTTTKVETIIGYRVDNYDDYYFELVLMT